MTGFGTGYSENDRYQFTFTLRSVNNKHLNIACVLSRPYDFLEPTIVSILKRVIDRGSVTVKLDVHPLQEESYLLSVSHELIEAYIHGLDDINEKFGLSLHLEDLSQIPDAVQIQAPTPRLNEDDLDALQKGLLGALDEMNRMKEHEGEHLVADMQSRLRKIKASVRAIESSASDLPKELVGRLMKRLKAAGIELELDEGRLHQEATLLADRCDITEEIVRLKSHLEKSRGLLSAENTRGGRKLDFIYQEMNREADTIASKAGKGEISQLVVELKTEISRLREQVRNVE